MSAVSSEAPQSADLSEAKPSSPAAGAGGGAPHEYSGDGGASKDFGPNEWLVDELYQRYLADPGSVDMAWWNFFADYSPPVGSVAARAAREPGQGTNGGTASAPAQAATPAPAAPGQARPDGDAQTSSPAQAAAPAAAPPKPGAPSKPAPAPATPPAGPPAAAGAPASRLRGAAARTAVNMASSLS